MFVLHTAFRFVEVQPGAIAHPNGHAYTKHGDLPPLMDKEFHPADLRCI